MKQACLPPFALQVAQVAQLLDTRTILPGLFKEGSLFKPERYGDNKSRVAVITDFIDMGGALSNTSAHCQLLGKSNFLEKGGFRTDFS